MSNPHIHPLVEEHLKITVSRDPDERAITVIASLDMKYGAKLQDLETAPTPEFVIETAKRVLKEHVSAGMYGFDNAIAKMNIGDGERLAFPPKLEADTDETRFEEFDGDKRLVIPGDQQWSPHRKKWVNVTRAVCIRGYKYRRPIQLAAEPEAEKGPSPAPGSDTPRTDAVKVAGNIKNQSDTENEWPWSAINRGYEFARTLERENTDLKNRIANVMSDYEAAELRVHQIEKENTAMREKMTEAWKLVNAMAGQEYWDRAETWLAENSEFKPADFVG